MAQLTVGSLFSGIGGLDLGLERAGMRVIWQSEIDDYACRVLRKHWPEVPNHGNIKEINWDTIKRPDVVCGGYPCQPFSTAGKRRGEDDPRHLWPWVREAISRLRPRYAILENVRGHLTLGGTTVLGELASIGYDAEWRVVSAASVGANHRRDRIIIVAYPTDMQRNGGNNHTGISVEPETVPQSGNSRGSVNLAHTDVREAGWRDRQDATDRSAVFGGEHYRRGTQSYAGWEWWQVEPDVGQVADGVPYRVDRLRGLGNAVVPQVAEVIGRLVVEHAAHN